MKIRFLTKILSSGFLYNMLRPNYYDTCGHFDTLDGPISLTITKLEKLILFYMKNFKIQLV